ncbi:hypothetical protein I4U23_017160 [Adineta vaga]|nr:hypothetical protein I4U23_017160 [Adineta vaga]
MNRITTISSHSIIIPMEEYIQLIDNQSGSPTGAKNTKKLAGEKVPLTTNMRKVVAARKLFACQRGEPSTTPTVDDMDIEDVTAAAGGGGIKRNDRGVPKTKTTTAAAAHVDTGGGGGGGDDDDRDDVTDATKSKRSVGRLNKSKTSTGGNDSMTTRDRHCTMSVTCLSTTPSQESISHGSLNVIPTIRMVSETECDRYDTVLNKGLSSSTITIVGQKSSSSSIKRQRSNEREPNTRVYQTCKYYTKGEVLNQEVFSTCVEKVIERAGLPSTRDLFEIMKREECASYYLDALFENAIRDAAYELRRKFRK